MPPKTPKSKTPARKKEKETEKQLSVTAEFQNVEISTKDPRTVVLMLDSPETTIVCKACEALKKYVEISEANCIEVLELGSLPRLVKLLSSAEKVIRSYTVICLAAMVTNGTVRRALYKLDSIPPLLTLLGPDEELVTIERASFSLSQLAVEYSYKVQLEKHSGHAPLIKLLSSPDADIQRNCVQTLCLMVEHYQSRPGVLEVDPGLPSILDLLQSEYAIIQELTLKTLHSCLHNAECRQSVVSGDGLGKLVSFLGNKGCSDLHALGVSVLALCLDDAESMVALQSSGCLQQLLSHITDSSSHDMKRHAANALAKAAKNSVNQKILHEQEAEKTFLDLLSSEDSGVVVSGCLGLTSMASLHSSRQLIGCEGGLAKLLQSAQSESEEVRANAARTIATLINGAPANQKHLSDADGVEVLVQLLTDSMAECRQFAAQSITSMATDESYRCQFETAGAVTNLVHCLNFADSSVQASSVEALGMLCFNASARQQFSSVGGVSSLLGLLRSSHQDVVYKATWALSVCARSTAIADDICKAGGLELVERLSDESTGHAQSAAAKSALVRLLDSNLSAKYWVTGHLEPSDLIKDVEFFDAGPGQSSSRPFTPLSELMSRPLTGNHPIITVNLVAKPPPPMPLSSGNTDEGGSVDASQSSSNVPTRTKSRQQVREGKKKGRPEKESGSDVSSQQQQHQQQQQAGDGEQITGKANLPGLLELDAGLWAHISHTQTNILPLPAPHQQVQEIAKYVSDVLGGAVERSGPLGYELPAGYIQLDQKSNLVPLGHIKLGAFQQRTLLFKVLCDQVGVACSLERGEYGRHWNKVWLAPPTSSAEAGEVSPRENADSSPPPPPVTSVYVVDVMFEPGSLLPAHAPSAHAYQHLT